MTSKICASCLRTFQRQSWSTPQTRKAPLRFTTSRAFTMTSPRYAELPRPTMPGTTIPSGTPTDADGRSTRVKGAKELRKVTGRVTGTYTAYGVTENFYKDCAHQAEYTIPQAADPDAEIPKTDDGEDLGVGESLWHTEFGLKPTFSTWSQVTMLHMYLLSARFRCLSVGEAPIFQQHLLNHFFYDAEDKMTVNHNMQMGGVRNKYLKDLFVQWRGLLAAYDEGLVKGDAVLAAAVWRNVFKASEEVDAASLAQIVSYIRRNSQRLDSLPNADVMMGESGVSEFGDPMEELKVVALESPMMKRPFEKVSTEPLSTPAKV